MDSLFGGGEESTSTQGPVDDGKLGKMLSGRARSFLDPNNPENVGRFTPIPQTADESAAFERMRAGLAPTPETLSSDISMFMNPYNDYVIDEINRQAGGDYSILKEAMTEAGQLGSNRQNIGAGDIDVRREGMIGQFMQDQFNNALGIATTQLPALRQQDIGNLMGIGNFQRGLDMQTRQAPIEALRTMAGIAPAIANQSTQTQKSGGGLGGLGGLLSGVSSIAGGPIGGAIGGMFGGGGGLSSGAIGLASGGKYFDF